MSDPTPSGDRRAFLAAVREKPGCETTRLAFADWLQEHGATDLDRATEEFIRLSCGPRHHSANMPKAAYEWLWANWRRLIPTALESGRLIPPRPGREAEAWQGASIQLLFPIAPVPRGHPLAVNGWLCARPRLEFMAGFLNRVWVGKAEARAVLFPLLLQDQPNLVDAVQQLNDAAPPAQTRQRRRKATPPVPPPPFVPAAPENA